MPGELDRTVARLQQEADLARLAKEQAERTGGASDAAVLEENQENLDRLREVCRDFSARATAEGVKKIRLYTGGVIPAKVWRVQHDAPAGVNNAYQPGLHVTGDGRPLIGAHEVTLADADAALVERFIDGMAKRLVATG